MKLIASVFSQIILIIVLITQSGCSTMYTKGGGETGQTYSGIEYVPDSDNPGYSMFDYGFGRMLYYNSNPLGIFVGVTGLAYMAVDFSFSLVADTVYYPVDKIYEKKVSNE